MAYPQTGSTLTGSISTGLSTQIVVKVENQAVGAIQSITVNHTRSVKDVKELGLDGLLEIVPDNPTTYSVDINRIVFDKKRLPEAFMRGFINIKAQLVPFDIDIIDKSGGGEGIVHTLKRCWFTSYKPSYTADSFVLSESATIRCEDISTTFGGSEKSAALGGQLPGYSTGGSSREQQADTGMARGSMDEPGIFEITRLAFLDE